jgi:acyl-CoA reductase-like NAD-dependent aldehyde dehydrogenase
LQGELKRTTFQLRLFAEVLRDGSFLQATIDHADPAWPMGARPDLRRMLRPIGPIAVCAASNFPFAFSVAGGDTASALAAGCSVLLKANPSHPELSWVTGAHVSDALAEVGAPLPPRCWICSPSASAGWYGTVGRPGSRSHVPSTTAGRIQQLRRCRQPRWAPQRSIGFCGQ